VIRNCFFFVIHKWSVCSL